MRQGVHGERSYPSILRLSLAMFFICILDEEKKEKDLISQKKMDSNRARASRAALPR
jgi:hypothetical protein